MSWEDEDWENKEIGVKVASDKWADEDQDDDEPTNEAPKSAPRNPDKKKAIGKKAEEKEKQAKPSGVVGELSAQQREQMEKDSDYQNATGLFSGLENAIDVNNPKDKRDFEVLASTLAEKLQVHQKSPFYGDMSKELISKLAQTLKPDELIHLSKTLSNMAHDKQKEEKQKKAPPSKKVTLNMKSSKDPFDGLEDRVADEDDYDEGGLMF